MYRNYLDTELHTQVPHSEEAILACTEKFVLVVQECDVCYLIGMRLQLIQTDFSGNIPDYDICVLGA